MITSIKFGGFYGGLHEQRIDSMIDFYEEEGDEFDNERGLEEAYGEMYVDFLNEMLGINMKFKGIDRPSYYNFTTDKIEAEIPDDKFHEYFIKVNDYMEQEGMRDELEEYIKLQTTCRDGYIAFFSMEDVLSEDNKDILFDMMLAVLCRESEDEWETYYDMHNGYEMIYNL